MTGPADQPTPPRDCLSDHSWNGLYGDPGEYSYGRSGRVDIHKTLRPLIEHLRKIDRLRVKLEQEGGTIEELSLLGLMLGEKIPVRCGARTIGVQLDEPAALCDTLRQVHLDLRFDVRQRGTYMPAYYLCRSMRDFWHTYSLIVEDLYMSPGYPLTDERFVRMMDVQHEVYSLRLSPFRDKTSQALSAVNGSREGETDRVLYDLGRHVFQAAWHEDQRLAVMISRAFGLEHFRRAVELLYLCLSGDLCELRKAIDGSMLAFFEDIYPHRPIHTFLGILTRAGGDVLAALPRSAEGFYKFLTKAFKTFLATDVGWSGRNVTVPLWKVLYGNFYRLGIVAEALRNDRQVTEAAQKIEADSESVTWLLLHP